MQTQRPCSVPWDYEAKQINTPFGPKTDNIYTVGSKSLQMVLKPISDLNVRGLFGPIRGVCLFGPIIPWDTMRTLCMHGEEWGRGGVCDIDPT